MSAPLKLAFFSDLHLGPNPDARSKTFAAIIDRLTREGVTELWLLGDIFDLCVGNFRFWVPRHADVFDALGRLRASGARIVWLEGNHDFHVAELLAPLGIEVVDAELIQVRGGRRLFLAHGDLVNPDDEAYLKWRAFTRNPRFRRLLDLCPDWFANLVLRPFAERTSRSSRRQERDTPTLIRDRYRAYAAARFAAGIDGVVLGHCHVDDLWTPKDRQFYLNLGSWLDGTARYATWSPDTEPFPNVQTCKIIEE